MMGLVAYSDSEDEEGHSPPPQTNTASRQPKALPEPSFILPDAGALLDGVDTDAALMASTKRSSTQVTGSSRPAPRPAKTAKGGVAGGASGKAARGGSAASGSSNSSRMLPPQLQGRKNVPTEDYARLFTKKTLSAANATNSTDAAAPPAPHRQR